MYALEEENKIFLSSILPLSANIIKKQFTR